MAGHKPSAQILLINGTFQFFNRRDEGPWKEGLIIKLESENTGGTRILIVPKSKNILLKPTTRAGNCSVSTMLAV